MTTTYDDEVNALLPKRNIDSQINTDALRQECINETREEKEKREMAARISRLKRTTIRQSHDDEKKAELVNELDKAKNGSMHARRTGDIIVVKNGEASLTGTTRTDVLKLLHKLNINLNMQLTKTDTQNLLATLLTCNEKQLVALQSNPKVPIVIKIVIKRLLEDLKTGEMTAIETLWDRIFGKAAMVVNLPETAASMNGIIPNTPVSREAYLVIRDTYLGRQ